MRPHIGVPRISLMVRGGVPELTHVFRALPTYKHAVREMVSDGVPIASLDTIVIMKLLAGRTEDLADIEGIVASGADREFLKAAVQRVAPARLETLQRLFENVDRAR